LATHPPGFKDDLWSFSNGDWSEIAISGTKPSGRSNAGLVAYGNGGAVLFGGFIYNSSATASVGLTDETWIFTPTGAHSGTWRQLHLSVHPSARAYFTFTNYGSGGMLFGGRNALWTNPLTALRDTWIFENGAWRQPPSTIPPTTVLQSLSQPAPQARWGHAVVCGLNASVPTANVEDAATHDVISFTGPADCMLYGGTHCPDLT
jgi:hypothetical protein